jgi:hypothetical protein
MQAHPGHVAPARTFGKCSTNFLGTALTTSTDHGMWDEGRTNCRRSKDVLLLILDATGAEVEAGIVVVGVVVVGVATTEEEEEEGDRVVINEGPSSLRQRPDLASRQREEIWTGFELPFRWTDRHPYECRYRSRGSIMNE